MKNILKIFTILTLTTFMFVSCDPDDEAENVYEGPALVHFDYSGRNRTFSVTATESTASMPLTFSLGLTKPAGVEVGGSLVFVAEESTAVLGTDFDINTATATIPVGSLLSSDFQLTLYSNNTGFEANGNQTNIRTAVFEYTNSSSVPNAEFYQRFTVNITTAEKQ